MRVFPDSPTLDDVVGHYGRAWTRGIITEHLHLVPNAVVRVAASGRTYVSPATFGEAVPVLCSELVPVTTEDGVISGRCGCYVEHNDFACPGHADEIRRYSAERDAEYGGLW